MTSVTPPDGLRETLFIADFHPRLGAYLARQHASGYDAVDGRARFILWLATHADDGDGALREYMARAVRISPLTVEEEIELATRIRDGRLAEERLAEGGDALADQARADLARVARDGVEASTRLQEANLSLVVPVAERFTGRGVPFSDLVQAGNLGLIRAVQRYDHIRPYRFATFATWWIRQAVARSVASGQSHPSRLAEPSAGGTDGLTQAERRMFLELGREPTPEELAAELDLSPSATSWSPRRPSRDRDL